MKNVSSLPVIPYIKEFIFQFRYLIKPWSASVCQYEHIDTQKLILRFQLWKVEIFNPNQYFDVLTACVQILSVLQCCSINLGHMSICWITTLRSFFPLFLRIKFWLWLIMPLQHYWIWKRYEANHTCILFSSITSHLE